MPADMSPLREWKKNGTELTSSLRPRKGIVVYNERQLQSAAREERRAQRASTSTVNHTNHQAASTSVADDNETDDTTKNSRKRSGENSKKKPKNAAKVAKVEERPSQIASARRSSRTSTISNTVSTASSERTSSASASPQITAAGEDEPLINGGFIAHKAMTVGEALSQRVNLSELVMKDSDKFDKTMESVLSNITSKSHPGYLKMSNTLASAIANGGTTKTSAVTQKPYVYKPRVPKHADENGILATILKNAAANSSTAALLSSYKPRSFLNSSSPFLSTTTSSAAAITTNVQSTQLNGTSVYGGYNTCTVPEGQHGVAAMAGSPCVNFASTSTLTVGTVAAATFQQAQQRQTLSAALGVSSSNLADVTHQQQLHQSTQQQQSVESSLSRLFGYSSATCLGGNRRVALNFTYSNPILQTSIPAHIEFQDHYRPFTQQPLPAIMSRTTVDIRSLGKALFHDDPSWSHYTFPKRSLFGSECLVYFYHSQRWSDRKLVLVPFGKSMTPGEFPYTCGSCFKFSACLRHRFDLAPRNKIPVVMARNGQLLDDPDTPIIPHICDPAQLSEKEKAALAEYGELMAGTREAKTPPKEGSAEACGEISVEKERHSLLLVVSRLTECCAQLMSVGFDFTTASLREKAFDIADEINLPRHCITDSWLQNVGRWLGISDGNSSAPAGCSEIAAAVIFGDAISGGAYGAEFASGRVNEAAAATFTNANDYLESMISEAMSREELQNQLSEDVVATLVTEDVETKNNVPLVGSDAKAPCTSLDGNCDGVSVLVKESCPIELVFNNEDGSITATPNIQLELNRKVKTEVDVPSEMDAEMYSITAAATANVSALKTQSTVAQLTSQPTAIASGDDHLPTSVNASTTRHPSSCSASVNASSRCSSVETADAKTCTPFSEPKESTSGGVPPLADKKTLYAVIQESFTKTNYPEVAKSLEVIRQHIMQRDYSLMPMFNNFSARIAKMMYTTKPRENGNGDGRSVSPAEYNGSPASIDSVEMTGGERLSARQRRQPSAAEISAAFDDIKPLFANNNDSSVSVAVYES